VDLFDGAKMNPNCVQRTSSTVALQSLALLNSEFVRVRSKALAARLCRDAAGEDERIELAFRLAVGRTPSKDERDAAVEFLRAESIVEEPAKAGTTNTVESPSTNKLAKAKVADESARWTNLCQMIFASNTFLFVE